MAGSAGSDESLMETVSVYACESCFFSSSLLTDFLQHNCSTPGEKDLRFGRRCLCFSFAFLIRALVQENTADVDQMVWLNPFRFLGEKKCSSICAKKSTENSIQKVTAPGLPPAKRARAFWGARMVTRALVPGEWTPNPKPPLPYTHPLRLIASWVYWNGGSE